MEPIKNDSVLEKVCLNKQKKDLIKACISTGNLDDLFLKYRKEKNYFQMRKILAYYLDELSTEVISDLSKRMWEFVGYNVELSEDFIRTFAEKVDWKSISFSQVLSEDFIREFHDKVAWDVISYRQVLSEGFIREFSEILNWEYISRSQKLSIGFICEFEDKINWENVPLGNVPGAAEFFE